MCIAALSQKWIMSTVHNETQNIEQNVIHMIKYCDTVHEIYSMENLHFTWLLKINISFWCNARHNTKKVLIQKRYKVGIDNCLTFQKYCLHYLILQRKNTKTTIFSLLLSEYIKAIYYNFSQKNLECNARHKNGTKLMFSKKNHIFK